MTLSNFIDFVFDYTKVNVYIRYSNENLKLFASEKAFELKKIDYNDWQINTVIADDYNEISIEVKHI